MQSKAEDEGILAYVEDDNAAMPLPGRRTCLDICLVCYRNCEEINFQFLLRIICSEQGKFLQE